VRHTDQGASLEVIMLTEIREQVNDLAGQLRDLAGGLSAGGKGLPPVEAAKLLVLLDTTRTRLGKAAAALAKADDKQRDSGPGLFPDEGDKGKGKKGGK
jgi:hypothetical protein